jgi:hypothetical protein
MLKSCEGKAFYLDETQSTLAPVVQDAVNGFRVPTWNLQHTL